MRELDNEETEVPELERLTLRPQYAPMSSLGSEPNQG